MLHREVDREMSENKNIKKTETLEDREEERQNINNNNNINTDKEKEKKQKVANDSFRNSYLKETLLK